MTAVEPLLAAARTDPGLVRIEGFHALKHALRFGAEILGGAAEDRGALDRLAAELAPDVAERVRALTVERSLDGLLDRAPHTGVVAVARRPPFDPAAVLAAPGPAPVVVLEDPRHLGNVGAVVRVAAAAGAAGVLTTGSRDPWEPAAVRGAAGLHFALPVGRVDPGGLPGARPLVALDPGGEPLASLPRAPLLAFGTERHGLSAELAARADLRVAIPMRPGVSSLNLATAVAVVLYRSG